MLPLCWGKHMQQIKCNFKFRVPLSLPAALPFSTSVFKPWLSHFPLLHVSFRIWNPCSGIHLQRIFGWTLIMQKSCFAFTSSPQAAVILHTWLVFTNPQQEIIKQTSSNQQINNPQPMKQCSNDQINNNKKLQTRIFLTNYRRRLTFRPNFAPHFSQSCGFSFLK